MNAPVNAPYGDRSAQGDGRRSEMAELDIEAVWRVLRRRLGLVVGTVLVGVVLAAIAVFQVTPLYSANTLVLIDPQQTQVVDIESVLTGLSPDSGTIDSQVEVLQSRLIAERVVDNLGLVNDAELNPALRSRSLISYFNPIGWIKALLPSGAEPLSEEEQARLVRREVVAQLRDRLTVNRRSLTYVIEVSFASEDPDKAAQIANQIADTYVLDQLEAKFEATRKANVWLADRLSELREALRDSERAVEIYKAENQLIETDGLTLNEQQLSELNAQLILIRAEKAEQRAKFDRVNELLARGASIDSVAEVLQSEVVRDLRQQQAELVREQAELASRYGPRHPQIINIQAERRDLDRQIEAEVRRIASSLENAVAVSETRERALRDSLEELRGTASVNNQALIRLRELDREANANRTLYESFLSRFKETAEQEDIQTPDARVISSATPPLDPSFPRKTLILGIVFVLSGIGGVALAFVIDRLDNTIHTATEMEELLGLPHIASLPAIGGESEDGKPLAPHDYVLDKPLSAFAESLRTLRTSLALSNVDQPPKVIMFTSALPNEGKSTTCLSFARAAAQAGVKTVLLDGDLRHPSIHKLLNVTPRKVGLVEYLAGRVSLADVLLTDERSGVRILPIASGVANPPDLLGSAQMRKLIKQLKDDYDLVLVDAAPVLPVVDSRVLARTVDKTVVIVRWNQTPRDASINAVQELRAYNADMAGCVFTQIDMTKRARYGYGDSGAYYSHYRKYYVE